MEEATESQSSKHLTSELIGDYSGTKDKTVPIYLEI